MSFAIENRWSMVDLRRTSYYDNVLLRHIALRRSITTK